MVSYFECSSIEAYKMNATIDKFLFTGDKFMLEMHLKHPKFSYCACG